MNTDATKTPTGVDSLSGNDIIQIFSLRAGGATAVKISEDMGINRHIVGKILRRQLHPDVPIPTGILKKVQSKYRKSSVRSLSVPPETSPATALGRYTAALIEEQRYRDQCLRIGIADSILVALKTSVRMAESGKQKPLFEEQKK